MEEGWTHLEEVVKLIGSNLYAAKDIQSCSLVCRTWRAALAEYRSPYLMLRSKGMWQFYQQSRSLGVNLPRLGKARICSSNHGWLLMQSQSQYRSRGGLFFIDPFNDRTVEIKQMRGKTPSYDAFHFFNPPTSPECFVIGIENKETHPDPTWVRMGILKRGHGNVWPDWDPGHMYAAKVDVEQSPPVFRGGFLYFVDKQGNVATLDVRHFPTHPSWTLYTKCLPFRRLRNKITKCFLFQFKGKGALYAVFLIHEAETVNVFRLSEPEMKWESVKDLGDNMVYLSTTSCFGDTAHSQRMANTILFPRFQNDDMLYYSLATRKYHSFHGNYSHNYDFDGSGLRKIEGYAHSEGSGAAWIHDLNLKV